MFKFSYFLEMIPKIFLKLNVTLTLTFISIFFALIIGTLLAVVIYYKVKVLDKLAYIYISIMRGTPIVAQLYFFYFGVAIYSTVVRDMSPMTAVAIVISLNVGAFMAESIRSALLSVDEGQKEAAYSLGMSNMQLVTRIIIPQAMRVAIPPLFNDVINIIKLSSLSFMVGVIDIMGAAKIEGAKSFRYFEIYAAVMVVYWVVIFVFDMLRKYLEKKCAAAF